MYEFKLPSSITISNCGELLNIAIEAKNNNDKIVLDSSGVETIDTAGIQMIKSFCKDEEKVTHAKMSDKVGEMMLVLGLLPG